MFSLRTKLILFMSMLTIFIGILSCLSFLIHSKSQQEEALKKLGTSLVMQLAQDSEVKHAMNYTQSAFLDAPIKRVQTLDMEEEIGYCRISNIKSVIIEEKAPWINVQMKKFQRDMTTKIQMYSLPIARSPLQARPFMIFQSQL